MEKGDGKKISGGLSHAIKASSVRKPSFVTDLGPPCAHLTTLHLTITISLLIRHLSLIKKELQMLGIKEKLSLFKKRALAVKYMSNKIQKVSLHVKAIIQCFL